MKLNIWMRQFHRWTSIAFTIAVIVNILAIMRGGYNSQLGVLAVVPLFLLLFSGLYLFALPYVVKRRQGGRAAG